MSLFRRSSGAPRRRRWRRRLLGCLLVLTLLLGLAPILIAHTPLLQWIASRALVRLRGQVRVGGASLSWFSAPVLTDVEVQDASGRLLARIPRIEGGRSLVGLLCSPLSPGAIRVVQPTMHLRCRGGRTNLEEALAAWLEDSDDTSGPDLAIRAEVIQAHFLFRDEDTGKETALDPLDLTLERTRDPGPSLHVQVHARSSHAQAPGSLDTDLTLRATEGGVAGLDIEGTIKGAGLPLALAEPFLRRLVPGIQLSGAVGADLSLRSGDGAPRPGVRLEGRLTVRDFSLGAPAWIGVDRFTLKRVEIPCRLTLNDPWVHVERAEVRSDVGTFRLAGKVDLSKGLNALLRQPGCEAGLDVDLVRLTDLFPDTLGLSPITRLTQGRLEAHMHSSADARGTHWDGNLSTTELRGLFEGQPVAWKAPLTLAFRTHPVTDGLPMPDWLRCDSDFLQVKATGTETQAQADLTYDLDRLSAHVRELIDLGGLRLGGRGSARLTLRQSSPGCYQLEGDASTTHPLLALPGGRVWRDAQASTHLTVSAEETKQGYTVKSGNLHMTLGQDALDGSLTRPLAELFSTEPLSARLHLHGDLARWQNRLGLAPGAKGGCQLTGQGDLSADLRWETEAVQLQDVKLHCDSFRCVGHGLTLQEPTLDLTTSGRWALDSGALTLKTTQLTAPGLVATAPSVSITDQVTGSLVLRGDLNRLQTACGGGVSWALPILPGATQVEGEVSLNLNDIHLPLADWTRTQAVGRLTLHSARITPGALVRELSVLLHHGPATLTLARESVVLLQVANGRVYQQGLELQLPELRVRSQGSVGFDGSLTLIAEMPVPSKWLGAAKAGSPLAGQMIRLPVGGTLAQPRLDAQAMRAANAQLLRNTAEDKIRRELDKRIEKLLPFQK